LSQSKELKDSKDPKADAKSAGKPRVYALAAELNLDTKAVLEFCKELGYAGVKNQLSALELDQADAIRDRAKRGPKTAMPAPTAPSAPAAKPTSPPQKLENKIPTLTKPKTLPSTPARPAPAAKAPTPAPEPSLPPVTPPVVEAIPEPVVEAPTIPPVVEVPKPLPVEVTPPVIKHPEPVVEVPATIVEKPTPAPVVEVPAPKPEPVPVVEVASVVEAPQVSEPVVTPSEPVVVAEAPARVVEPTPATPMPSPNMQPNRMPNLSNRPPALGNRPPSLSGNRPATILPPKPPGVPSQPPRPAAPQGTNPNPNPNPAPRPGAPAPGGNPNLAGPNRPQPAQTGGPGQRPGPNQGGPGGPPRPGPHQPPRIPGAPGQQRQPGSGQGQGPNNQGGGGNQQRGPNQGPSRPPGQGAPQGPGASKTAGPQANKSVKLTPEQIQKMRLMEQQRGVRLTMDQVQKQITAPPPEKPRADEPAAPGSAPRVPDKGRGGRPGEETAEEAERRGGGGGGGAGDKRRPGGVVGREDRQAKRQDKGRQRGPTTDKASVIIGAGGSVDIIEEQRGSRMKRRPGKGLEKHSRKTLSGKVEITLPITVRNLSETIGMKAGEVILKLKNLTNSLYTINSTIEFEVAEMIAIEKQIELVAKKQETVEDKALRELEERALKSDSANVVLRPPIVTIMGHVDHGKTSLLDKIRQTYGLLSDVVSSEAGGITQVLRAWRVEKDGKSTTFLDTPGHEAFTKMRARGANVTDIAVIVVSASDGVMPQTEEAVAHAKAADVDIIVAINKVDLPDANIDKTRRQLYNLNLLPDNMGGEVPFVECSAKTGKGIDELLDNIATLAELAELKADPSIAGSGTCLEGYMEGEKGVVATLMVQNGTLRKGDIVLCGATYGRVRAMYSDLGRQIDIAGPSTPVKIIGLSEVPDADDPFFVVDDLSTAREIASKRRESKLDAALNKFSPVSLDKLKEASAKIKITELKVILKAEARGSVEAIKKELEKLIHEEVRVRVLHSGIGAITESDVTLALTSPADTMIVGFNVTADDPALALAESRDISIREYQIIYNLVDDVKAALEGRLKPTEEVIHLGRAVVRETFKISKVGTVAGCHVTSGVLERSARVRVIREGTVIFPPAEKHIGLDNLKRFKDDVKEVREGFECGLKISGFDDIKVGDVIEAFKIEIRYRKL
jgi:translation initiation factor IF-2